RRALLLLALAGCGDPLPSPGGSDEGWAAVIRDDLVLEVDVTGTLRATRSMPIGPPSVAEMWDFKIVRMASEGAEVKEGGPELAFLRDRHQRAEVRVQRLQSAVKQMTVRSPVNGLVVYRKNWRSEKKKVGDSCWAGDECLEVVDVSQMMANGEVEETESARLR